MRDLSHAAWVNSRMCYTLRELTHTSLLKFSSTESSFPPPNQVFLHWISIHALNSASVDEDSNPIMDWSVIHYVFCR